MRGIQACPSIYFSLLLLVLTSTANPRRAMGEDWSGTLGGEDTEMTLAVADSTNLNDGFDWYVEATLNFEDEYIDSVGVEADASTSESDGGDFGGPQDDIELDDAYVGGNAPIAPGVTLYVQATSYVCVNGEYGQTTATSLDSGDCDWDIMAEMTFIAGTPSISGIAPSSDLPGASGQITLEGQYLGDPFGGGFTSYAVTGSGVNLSGGSSSDDVTSYTLNYSIDQNASPGAYSITLTNPFGTSNAVTFTVGGTTPSITGISPDTWSAGTTTQVTITGESFGTNPPALTLSDSSISYSLVTYSDTQIVANMTVPSGTPDEDVSIAATNNGYGGSSFYPVPGQSAQSPSVHARVIHSPTNTPEITVIAWIDGTAPDIANLPSGANSTLVGNLNGGTTSCLRQMLQWYLGIFSNITNSTDAAYANSWLLQHSSNPAPPSTITPAAQQSAGNYRLYNDFGNGGGSYQVGSTPNPCPGAVASWFSPTGQASQYMGRTGTSPSGEVYLVAEGRICTSGQKISQTINGRTVPWIWSAIEFDSSGNPNTTNHAIFPTYSVYSNGVLVNTYAQSPVANMTTKDDSYQLDPAQIP